MSNTQRSAGTALVEWIDTLLAPGQSLRAFCQAHGLDDARMSAWRAGATPRLDHLRIVAEGLGVPLAEVLIRSGLTTADEVQIIQADPTPPSIDDAIERDPELRGRPDVQALLRNLMTSLRSGAPLGVHEIAVPKRKRAPRK